MAFPRYDYLSIMKTLSAAPRRTCCNGSNWAGVGADSSESSLQGKDEALRKLHVELVPLAMTGGGAGRAGMRAATLEEIRRSARWMHQLVIPLRLRVWEWLGAAAGLGLAPDPPSSWM